MNTNISGNTFINVAGLSGTAMRVNKGINGGTLNIVQLAPTAANVATELDRRQWRLPIRLSWSAERRNSVSRRRLLPLLAAAGGVAASSPRRAIPTCRRPNSTPSSQRRSRNGRMRAPRRRNWQRWRRSPSAWPISPVTPSANTQRATSSSIPTPPATAGTSIRRHRTIPNSPTPRMPPAPICPPIRPAPRPVISTC